MGLVLNLILCMVLLLTPYLVLQVLHMQPIRLLQVLHLYLSNLVSKFPRKYARKARSKPTSRLPGSSVVMFLTESVPGLRRKLVPSDRDLSRSSPTRGSVPSNTGRSVRTSRTSRSNVLKFRMKNATVLPSFSVSCFPRMSKKLPIQNNVPLSMIQSVP